MKRRNIHQQYQQIFSANWFSLFFFTLVPFAFCFDTWIAMQKKTKTNPPTSVIRHYAMRMQIFHNANLATKKQCTYCERNADAELSTVHTSVGGICNSCFLNGLLNRRCSIDWEQLLTKNEQQQISIKYHYQPKSTSTTTIIWSSKKQKTKTLPPLQNVLNMNNIVMPR